MKNTRQEFNSFNESFREPTINGCYVPSKEVSTFGNVKYFRMGDLFANDKVNSQKIETLMADLDETRLSKHCVERGDLLFCRTSVQDSGVGKCSVVTNASYPLVPASNLIRVRVDTKKTHPMFAYYYFKSEAGAKQLRNMVRGAAIFTITGGDIGLVKFPKFSLTYQSGVVSILEGLDDLIDNNTRRIEILEESAKALYREWFVHYRYPGHENDTMIDSELGPIPSGWESTDLASVCKVSSGFAFKSSDWQDDGIPVVKIHNVRDGRVKLDGCAFISAETASNAERYQLFEGDILITMSGEIGSVGRVNSQKPIYLNQRVGRFEINSNSKIESDYLFLTLWQSRIKKYFENISYGTAQPNISPSLIGQTRVVLPPVELQRLFGEQISEIFTLSSLLESTNYAMQESRDLLLPRLISGELDVTDLDLVA